MTPEDLNEQFDKWKSAYCSRNKLQHEFLFVGCRDAYFAGYALASHAPSEPRCSNCKRLPSEYEPGMCSECDWRKDHSSEPELPQVVMDSPICDICGNHTLDARFHHTPGSQGNMQASEAAAQPKEVTTEHWPRHWTK